MFHTHWLLLLKMVSGTLDVYSEIQAQNRYQLANTLRIKIDA